MTYDGLTETQRAFLSSREHEADFEDLSAVEVNKLSFDDWAARTGRPTMGEIAVQAHAYASRPTPAAPGHPQAVSDAPQQPDPAAMSWQTYAQWREQSGLAARSAEGMSRASLSMADRWLKPEAPVTGRRDIYR